MGSSATTTEVLNRRRLERARRARARRERLKQPSTSRSQLWKNLSIKTSNKVQIERAKILSDVRHKVFISYHHDDEEEATKFIETFDYEKKVFICRVLGCGMEQDIIDSTDVDYVMGRIRKLYLKDSTVTIVLIGKCTWSRRYVDWEIQSSLRHGETVTPNGLLGIVLPSAHKNPIAPSRLDINLDDDHEKAYARWYCYPTRTDYLSNWIENAYKARTTKAHLIKNPRDNFRYNRQC